MGSYSVRTSRNFEKGGIFLIILGGHIKYNKEFSYCLLARRK